MKNKLDQFYTNPKVTDELIKTLQGLLINHWKEYNFIEPSAGSGNFIDSLVNYGINIKKIYALDIEPKERKTIIKKDYLETTITYKKNNIVIGNPPFGKRAKLALKFLNKALTEADIVGFILPYTFKRFSIQRQINEEAKLIYEEELPKDSFLVNDKRYDVNCVFQIWTTKRFKTFSRDRRLRLPLTKEIKGLKTYIHNNTKATLKYFNKNQYKWDFAVVRQGFYNYNEKITDSKLLVKNRQYMFFKITSKAVENIINEINFEELSKNNTTIPGFSKTDLIDKILEIQINKMIKF